MRAALAIAHKILVAAYHMLAKGLPYRELGEAYLDQIAQTRTVANLKRRIERLGYNVTLEPKAEPSSFRSRGVVVAACQTAARSAPRASKRLRSSRESARGRACSRRVTGGLHSPLVVSVAPALLPCGPSRKTLAVDAASMIATGMQRSTAR